MQGLRPIKIADVQLKFLFGKGREVTLLLREFSFRDEAAFFNLMAKRLMVRTGEEFDLSVIEFVCLERRKESLKSLLDDRKFFFFLDKDTDSL